MIDGIELLVCPLTGQPLTASSLEDADAACAGRLEPRSAGPAPAGRTPVVLVRADRRVAYPVVDGIPVLLGPERLVPTGEGPVEVDLQDARHAEAYEEMTYYNQVAETEALDLDVVASGLARIARMSADE